jgi:hypothetical protein
MHGEAGREAMELVGMLTAYADSLSVRDHYAAHYYLAWVGETALLTGPCQCTAQWTTSSRR